MRLLVALLVAAVGGAAAQKPPNPLELKKLIESYLGQDARTRAGRDRQRKILQRVDLVPPLKASQVKSWRKKLLKAAAKAGPRLDKKGGGSNFFWEKQRKGLYIVGGRTKRPKGLLLGMHGGGKGSGDARSSHAAFDAAASKLGWVAIFPQVLVKTEHGWTDSGTEEFVIDLVEAAKRTWKIDRSRVFFAGHSMGGYGSWTLGAHHADMVAAVAPSAGAPTPVRSTENNAIVDIVEGVIPNLRNVPMIIYQSDDDPQVPPDVNQAAVKFLAKAKERWGGYDYEYWQVSGRGHASPPGGMLALLEKIAQRQRNAVPAKVVWQPVLPWKRQFYWLFWEAPVRNAIVVADADMKTNRIKIECEQDTAGLSLLLDERIVDMKREVVVTIAGEAVYRGIPQPRLSAMLLTAVRNDPDLMFPCRIPLGDR